jgi:hypothetical protein
MADHQNDTQYEKVGNRKPHASRGLARANCTANAANVIFTIFGESFPYNAQEQ